MQETKKSEIEIQEVEQIFKRRIRDKMQSMGDKQSSQSIRISNRSSKYTLNFGEQFKTFLEPRDQVLEHSFDFTLPVEAEKAESFEAHRLPSNMLKSIKKFLVESASNVTSAAFKFLCNGDLTGDEAKEYASKNLLLNINSIFRETMKGVKEIKGLSLKAQKQDEVREILVKEGLKEEEVSQILAFNWEQLESFKETLQGKGIDLQKFKEGLSEGRDKEEKITQNFAIEVDNMMSDILVNLADNYPQAPPSGGTPRMREAIMGLNRTQDEENDLIFSNQIKLCDYLTFGKDENEIISGDYTKFIMEVINTAIRVTQESKDDYKDRTVKEKFSQFNQKLFCLAQQEKYQNLINNLQEEIDLRGTSVKADKNSKKHQQIKILQYFLQTLESNESKSHEIDYKQDSEFDKLSMEKKIQEFKQKAQKTYGVGQKIPSFVKEFSKQEIANNQFTSKHSSILRILTKWTSYLEEIFMNPEKQVYGRTYPFKTVNNQKVILQNDYQGNEKLVKQLKDEYKIVIKKYEIIIKNCYQFIGKFLSKSQKSQSFVGRYSDTRIIASKINAILTSHMLAYANTLIHHLIKAGSGINTDYGEQNINLVMFKVSDLLRAKLQCSENSFISLLKTMYLLDNDDSMKDKFKIVRIKSKLDEAANNIMINYLFMGKVQCQLQLSIQEPKGKEKNYFTFSHFVYELTRGRFGSIAECAIMISQLDPMISACKQSYYAQKRGAKLLKTQETDQQQEYSELQQFEQTLKRSMFQCSRQKCKKIVINQKQDIFERKIVQKICNSCFLENQNNPLQKIADQKLKDILKEDIFELVNTFGSLSYIKCYSCLAILSEQGKLSLNIVIVSKEQLKTFLVRLDSQTLDQMFSFQLDFSSLDYFDITEKILKEEKNGELMFRFDKIDDIPESFFQQAEIERKIIDDQIVSFVQNFIKFRTEKNLIKNIKFKVGIINTNYNQSKWSTLCDIAEELGSPPSYEKSKQITLKYKKYKHLDLSTIKQIYSRNIELYQLPKWLPFLKNLKNLILDSNNLTNIDQQLIPLSVTSLDLFKNSLTKVDLRKLINLTTLQIGNNKLEAVELKGLINLTQLNLHYNNLKQIDLSSLINLTKVRIFNNQLEEINLNNLTNLTQLTLTQNKLANIDVSSLTNLTLLLLQNNKLRKIDLSCVPNLVTLNLFQNEVEEIDLSNQKKLQNLTLISNKLTEIDLSCQTHLKELNIKKNKLKDIQYLPLSLKQLSADKDAVVNYDFIQMKNLTYLEVYKGSVQKSEMKNLGEKVQFANYDEEVSQSRKSSIVV